MRVRRGDGVYLLRLERGEELMGTLAAWAESESLYGATLVGIGVLEGVELAFYDREAQEYRRQRLEGEWELVSLLGNLTQYEGRALVHAHALLAGRDLIARAGHLVHGVVSVTGEIQVFAWGTPVGRALDETVGLPLMEL